MFKNIINVVHGDILAMIQKKGSGNEITLLRSIYKNDDYDILSKRTMNERDGKKKSRVVLIFIKKT